MCVPDLNWKSDLFQDAPEALNEPKDELVVVPLAHPVRSVRRWKTVRPVWTRRPAARNNVVPLFGFDRPPGLATG
jgi:hypothetical protein